jgi:Ser/Thr protein kinase RdoA (MazF antagonist)
MTSPRVGTILANLALSVHKTPPPPEVISQRVWMSHSLRRPNDRIPPHIAAGVLALIERPAPGDVLCHCDLHPGNVIMTADGPRLVDWSALVRAPAALDLAVCHVLLSELTPETVDDPERPRAYNAVMRSEYARLAGLSPAALAAAIRPHLPLVRVLALLGGAFPAQRERLIQRVEAALRGED